MRTVIAFISNLDSLSTAQLKEVGKAISRLSPERVSEVVEAIGISRHVGASKAHS